MAEQVWAVRDEVRDAIEPLLPAASSGQRRYSVTP
jgi:hypothetical protein